jgi:hypothetical protein
MFQGVEEKMTVEQLIKRYAKTTEKPLDRPKIQLSKEYISSPNRTMGYVKEEDHSPWNDSTGQPPAKIPVQPGQSGSSGVFTNPGPNRMQTAQRLLTDDSYDPALGPSSIGEDGQPNQPMKEEEENPLEGSGVRTRMDEWGPGCGMDEEWTQRLAGIQSRKTVKIVKGMRKSATPSDFTNFKGEVPFQLTKTQTPSLERRLRVLGTTAVSNSQPIRKVTIRKMKLS